MVYHNNPGFDCTNTVSLGAPAKFLRYPNQPNGKMTTLIPPTPQDIHTRLILLLDNMTQEWGTELLEPLGAETRLVEDLGFESVDLMQLIVAIEQAFGVRGLPYDQVLMRDGGYVTEITVRQLTDFLHRAIPSH